MNIPLSAQIECVERELRYRAHTYARLVAKGRMTPEKKEHEQQTMAAVLATLRELEEKERLL